jgi:hypothetical protein
MYPSFKDMSTNDLKDLMYRYQLNYVKQRQISTNEQARKKHETAKRKNEAILMDIEREL